MLCREARVCVMDGWTDGRRTVQDDMNNESVVVLRQRRVVRVHYRT